MSAAISGFPLLSALMLVPLLATAAVVRLRSVKLALRVAFAATLLDVLLSICLLLAFQTAKPGLQLAENLHFLGISYSVGVDGFNILFVPLTAVLAFLVLLYTTSTRLAHDKLFIACILGYETVLMGAFTAMNLMQFWLWSLLELIPVILLSVDAGTGQLRRWVVTLFLQYWGSGLLMILAGFLFLAFGLVGSDHDLTFNWLTLKENNAYLHDETLIFILLFFGFSIRMPLFPFHGWLPLLAEHGAAASAPIFLVGVKLGVYALIRFVLPLLPGVAEQWQGFALALGLISVCYGALLGLMQINIRRLLACAVLSHTGLLAIGIFCFNDAGLEASLLLTAGYGLATAGLWLSVGLIYERARTAYIPRLGGLFDGNASIALLFLVATLSTMIMPGSPGFAAAHLLIRGVLAETGWPVAIAVLIGNVATAALLLRTFHQVFITGRKRWRQRYHRFFHSILKERLIAVTCCLLLIGAGYYTSPWLKLIDRDAAALSHEYPVHGSESAVGDESRKTAL